MLGKALRGKYQGYIACWLFLIACGIKWYYMAQQHYYVLLNHELVAGYNFAKTSSIKDVLLLIFPGCCYTLGSLRPFFSRFLFFLTFKWFGYQPQVVWIMGIIVGSLLVPLFFLLVDAMINVEVALASSLILSWMGNYIGQSITMNTVLPGILFIVGALLAAVRYHQKRGVGYLFLAGWLISMSVFCRYENALLMPVFIGYEYLFDKEKIFPRKLVYGLLCASSSLYILFCSYHNTGDPFHAIRLQQQNAIMIHRYHGTTPFLFIDAFKKAGELLATLWNPLLWGTAVAGMALMIMRHKLKALYFFSGVLSLPLVLVYKLKHWTLDHDQNYFFLLALIALPVGLECVRALFSRWGRRRGYGVMALGVVAIGSICSLIWCNRLSPDSRLRYPPKLVRLTEDLKSIPATSVLYLDNDLNNRFYITFVLFYLGRHPEKYMYFPGKTEPPEKEYYILTAESKTDRVPRRERVKVRDYHAYGFDDMALYHITQFSPK